MPLSNESLRETICDWACESSINTEDRTTISQTVVILSLHELQWMYRQSMLDDFTSLNGAKRIVWSIPAGLYEASYSALSMTNVTLV